MATSDVGNQVAVPVQLEEADFRRANLWLVIRQPTQVIIPLICLLGALTCYLVDLVFLTGVLIFAPILSLAGGLLAVYFNTKRGFSDLKEHQKRILYTFTVSGLDSNNEVSNSHTSWGDFLKAVESKHSFNLFLGRGFFIPVPKRFIENSADLDRIREILRSALGDKAAVQSGN